MPNRTKLSKEIAKLNKKGLLEVVDLLLVSPRFFKQLLWELELPNMKFIEYEGIIIKADKRFKGDLIFPYINRKKLS